jgi:hypothetical protein
MLTRSDLLRAHEQRLRSTKHAAASFPLPSLLGRHA